MYKQKWVALIGGPMIESNLHRQAVLGNKGLYKLLLKYCLN